ncbi:uncharacterized protein LOC124131493 [Haliotis rufescens]|uniref:uncharacterized protein LOC124131493 n=1 Tax=Haliotis rufescens TaxID=6454 RepID=UPI001EB0A808|nr:uncharacterized protein LOC124131493 [Haliotis rufescens]
MASGTSKYGENGGNEDRDSENSSESEEHDRNTNQRVHEREKKPAKTDATTDDEKKEATFSLTDPEALLEQLESVELTEEDTEELLHEAYKVNMKLKEMLRRQEAKRRDRLSSAKSAYSTASNSRKHPGPSVLPPITKKSSASDSKRRGDSSKKPRHPSSTSKSAKEKPIWDDRFSFS